MAGNVPLGRVVVVVEVEVLCVTLSKTCSVTEKIGSDPGIFKLYL